MPGRRKTVDLSVDLNNNRAHLFDVTIKLDCPSSNQIMSLPSWTPGSYMVREFAQHIVTIRAVKNGRDIAVKKINKNTFELQNSLGQVAITYQVYGFDSSIRAAFIDDQQAFFNGTALFLRPHGSEDARFVLNISRPFVTGTANWQVATGMTKMDTDSDGFGTYTADSYDELVDHPCQVSSMKRVSFMVSTIPHEIALVGDVRPFDDERLSKDLAEVCETQVNLFGESAPFASYLFIARFEEGGYGGLEHRNSSMLLSSPYCLPKKGLGEPDNQYRSFLALCSHEYFHAWNVKRLKPHNFVSYDFDGECYTTMLWIFEGITSYYDDLCVKRAGLISLSSYLELMGKNYGRLLRNRGRHVQSVAESSFDAWIKFYRQNENSLNTSVSYYLKGSFIGLYLDLVIRFNSEHQKSLDDVMRAAFDRYGRGAGIKEDEFLALLSEIGGIDTEDFKRKYIYGTDELPIKDLFHQFGIDCSIIPDELSVDDKTKMSAFLGLRLRFDDNARCIVSFVEQDGPAMRAGMSPFDEMVAIDHVRIDGTNAPDLLAGLRVGESVDIVYARKKLMKSCSFTPSELPVQTCKLSLRPEIDAKDRGNLEKWLGSIEIKSGT